MKTCNCYEETQTQLKAEGLSISSKCRTFRITKLKMSAHLGFPLQTEEGKKPKRGQPGFLFLSFCPFCGQKYETTAAARQALQQAQV
jgi:hypothetical protein